MIINPIWFYLMSICDKLEMLFFILGVILLVFGGVLGIFKLAGEDIPFNWNTIKKILVGGIICTICTVLCPPEKTLIKMLVASQINETNIERVQETVDYIIDKINGVKGEAKND